MIPIGGQPILWHLMSYYSQYGHKDFILCLGYKANVIKEFFLNYQPHLYSDCVVSGFGTNVEPLGDPQQDWRVTLIDTGVGAISASASMPCVSTSKARRCFSPITATDCPTSICRP